MPPKILVHSSGGKSVEVEADSVRTVGDLKAQAYEHFTVTSSGTGQAGAPPGRSSAGPSVLPAAELCLWVDGRPLQDAELVRDLTVRLTPVTSGATEVPATGSSGAAAAEAAASAAAAAPVTLHLARKPGKPCGLFARASSDGPGAANRGAALHLAGVEFDGEALYRDATMTLRQTFINTNRAAVTADYFFPMTTGVAIYSVEAVITDAPGAAPRVIRATVREKQKARIAYATAIAAGREAVLMERSEESEDVFKLGVGNVPASARVVVSISFLTELVATANEMHRGAKASRLVIARHLLHRYGPASDCFRESPSVLGAWAVSDAVSVASSAAASPLQVRLTFHSPVPLAAVTSPSHSTGTGSVSDEHGPGRYRGSFALSIGNSDWSDDLNAEAHADVHVVVAELPHSAAGAAGAAGVVALSPAALSPAALELGAGAGTAKNNDGAESLVALEATVHPSRRLAAATAVAGATSSEHCDVVAAASTDGSAPSAAAAGSGLEPFEADARLTPLDSASAITVAVTLTPALAAQVLASQASSGAASVTTAGAVVEPSASFGRAPAVMGAGLPLDDAVKMEYIFLLDISGSMDGSRINAARRALQLALQQLPARCSFGIVTFESKYQALMLTDEARRALRTLAAGQGDMQGDISPVGLAGMVPRSTSTVDVAMRLLDGVDATGGTELLEPMRACCSGLEPGVERHILLFTDGEVSNTREVIAVARSAAEEADGQLLIHAFGIGSGVSTALLTGLTSATGGSLEYIADGEAYEGKVAAVLEATLAQRIAVSVDWGVPEPAWAPVDTASRPDTPQLSTTAAAGGAGAAAADGETSAAAALAEAATSALPELPGLPAEATLTNEPVRLFAVLPKATGAGSTAAALAGITISFRDTRAGGERVTVPLSTLPSALVIGSTGSCDAAAPLAAAAHDDPATHRVNDQSPGALTLRAVQTAIRALESAEDGNSMADAGGESCYHGPLRRRLPASNAAQFCRKQATALSIYWGVLCRHTAFMGEGEPAADAAEPGAPASPASAALLSAAYYSGSGSAVVPFAGVASLGHMMPRMAHSVLLCSPMHDTRSIFFGGADPHQYRSIVGSAGSSYGASRLGTLSALPQMSHHDSNSIRVPRPLAAAGSLAGAMTASGPLALLATSQGAPTRMPYRVKVWHPIDSGSSGAVYIGEYQPHPSVPVQSPVAIKILSDDASGRLGCDVRLRHDHDGRVALSHELHGRTRVRHPNLVKLLGLVRLPEAPDRLAVIEEFCGGGNLESAVTDLRPMLWSERLAIAQQIAAGLAHLHARGMVHGNLEPSNVLLSRERDGSDRVKLADFGLTPGCLRHHRDGPGAASLSALAYTAPELLPSDTSPGGECSPASDIYAFGILLWQLMTQRRPYMDASGAIHQLFAARAAAGLHGDHVGGSAIKGAAASAAGGTTTGSRAAGVAGDGRDDDGADLTVQLRRCLEAGCRPCLDADVVDPCTPPFIISLVQACWSTDPGARPSAEQVLHAMRARMSA